MNIIETLKLKCNTASTIELLTQIMTNEITPRLSADIHDLEAVGMLDEVIRKFEEVQSVEPTVCRILEQLYEIRDYAYEQNRIEA